ncbi:MAG: RHS repeat-associated core domain-containing protein [Sulfuricaulis sp.]|nr:RHS repeat-associated core domain-containing protein [Sulfuricaulis sp.]
MATPIRRGNIFGTPLFIPHVYNRAKLSKQVVPSFVLKQVYDSFGYLKEVRQDTTTGALYWQATEFDAHNRLTKETYGNNVLSTRAYNHETADLVTITTGSTSNPTAVQNSSFTFDALDNLTTRNWWDGTAIRAETFGYDNLNRLTTVTGPANKTYGYALNGNITSKTSVGNYNYPTNGIRPHAVTSTVLGTTTTSYAYDANGNMTTRAGRTITYSSFNKPISIGGASGTTALAYDAHYNRVYKSAPGVTTTYVGKLYEKTVSGTTTTQKNYLYAGSNLVGAYSIINGTPNTRYFHTDHLGSVEVITNETGGVVQRLSYDAFGKRRNVNGTDATSITAQTTRGFTRHEQDDEVGLVNMNAREYDYVLGRFITADTIIPGAKNSQSYNRYSYVNNNPLTAFDPTGHWSLKKYVKAGVKFVTKPSLRNTFDFIHAQPGHEQIDRFVMTNRWAYSIGQMVATVYTAPCGGCGGAAWASYYGYQATGSVNAGLKSGAVAWASSSASAQTEALQWYGYPTYIGANAAVGYGTGYLGAKANGASDAQARGAAMHGAGSSAGLSLMYVGYNEATGMTPSGKAKAENTFSERIGQDTPNGPTTWKYERSPFSEWVYANCSFCQSISGAHDVFTGSVGSGYRDASNLALANFVNTPPGALYNWGTMPMAALWTSGATIMEVNGISAVIGAQTNHQY